MKYVLGFLIVVCCLSCAGRSALMTYECYAMVEVGSTIEQIEKSCGKPYQVHSRGGNTDLYEYIERISVGTQLAEMRHYFIVVTDGKVVGKYMRYVSTPAIYEGMYPDQPYPQDFSEY